MSKGTVITILIAGIFIFFLMEDKKRLQGKIIELQKDRLKLIQDALSNSNISKEVKAQIEKLIQNYRNVDEDIANELISVLALIDMRKEEKAIKDLAKIIENILHEKFKSEDKFKKNKNYIPLAKLIDYAKETKLFNKTEYNAACILKEFRNEESHKLNVKYGSNWKTIGLLGGIEIIFKLRGEKIA